MSLAPGRPAPVVASRTWKSQLAQTDLSLMATLVAQTDFSLMRTLLGETGPSLGIILVGRGKPIYQSSSHCAKLTLAYTVAGHTFEQYKSYALFW